MSGYTSSMTTTKSTYVPKNERWIRTDAGLFWAEQRLVGFADNDGRWTVTQMSECEYRALGALVRTREARHLGIFDTDADAMLAIRDAERMPEIAKILN